MLLLLELAIIRNLGIYTPIFDCHLNKISKMLVHLYFIYESAFQNVAKSLVLN